MKKSKLLQSWNLFHPNTKPTSVDYAYLKISQEIYDSMRFTSLRSLIDDDNLRLMLCTTVTAYFEDVVSYLGFWRTFVSKHKEMYGKNLPFYNTPQDSYYEDEVNLNDIKVLIWTTLQKYYNDGILLDPEHPGIDDLANKMYIILNRNFEKVPQNDFLLEYLTDKKHFTDFKSFKTIADWMCYRTYYNGYENLRLLHERGEFLSIDDEQMKWGMVYSYKLEAMYGQLCGPLALPVKDWISAWLNVLGMEEEAAMEAEIEFHKADMHLLLREDEKYFYVKDALGVEISVLRSSFKEVPKDKNEMKVLGSHLVKFKGEWHAHGMSVWYPDTDMYTDAVKKAKNEIRDKQRQYKQFMKANNGSPFAYFKNMSDAAKWFKKNIDSKSDLQAFAMTIEANNIVLFASPDNYILMLPITANYIKDPANPYYNEKNIEEDGMVMLVDAGACPKCLFHYLIEHKMFPTLSAGSLNGKENGRKLIEDNFDFIARYSRWNYY